MKPRGMRRAALVASGIAMATSLGLTGAGAASASAPASEIHIGATWTFEPNGHGCEEDVFHAGHTFTTDEAHVRSTLWSTSGPKIELFWKIGKTTEVEFDGHQVSSANPAEYRGKVIGLSTKPVTAFLVEGGVAGC